MNNNKKLGLYLPEQTPSRRDSFLRDPARVASWIEGLPMASIGETARQVFKALVEFNRMELPAATRIKVAELFHPPVRYLSDGLKKYYYDASFPLAAKSHRVAILNRELYAELATAYKIFIEEMLASGSTRKLDRKLLVIALHRTLRLLGHVIYQSAIVYEPYPKGVWREVHRIFAYAERARADELPVREKPGGPEVSTIRDVYKRILLFAASSPYRLRQPETTAVYTHLAEWSSHLRLEEVDQQSHSSTLFIGKLDSDSPPAHISIQARPLGRNCRQLDTADLVTHLKKTADELSTAEEALVLGAGDQLREQLLLKLISVLSSRPQRRYVRTRLNFELNTAAGLLAIHAMAEQSRKQRGEMRPHPASSDNNDDDLDDLEWLTHNDEKRLINIPLYGWSGDQDEPTIGALDDPLDELVIESEESHLSPRDGGAPVWAMTAAPRIPDPFNCKTDNESAGGFCILWHGDDAPPIKVGEVLGIQSASDHSRFSIGIARWMRNAPVHGLQVGVEFIASDSIPVTAGRLTGGGVQADTQKCLLLPGQPTLGIPPTLVTPSLPFRVGDHVWIDGGNGRRELELTRLVDASGAFSRFQFGAAAGHTAGEDDFDDIWSRL